jgi:hypothetical protein
MWSRGRQACVIRAVENCAHRSYTVSSLSRLPLLSLDDCTSYAHPRYGKSRRTPSNGVFSKLYSTTRHHDPWHCSSAFRCALPNGEDSEKPTLSYLPRKSHKHSGSCHLQTRWIHSKGEKKESTPKKPTVASISPTAADDASNVTDPDFASYLTGGMKPTAILNDLGIEDLSSGALLKQRRSSAKKRSRTLALDSDKDLYQQIIDTQIMKREESRLKTRSNVYRALIGNVVICSGTC